VRSVDKRELVVAMIWVTIPALASPMIGPPIGGFITTFLSWQWIFFINIPMGIAGIVLATIYIEDVRVDQPDPFDARGTALAGLGIAGLVFGGSLLGLNLVPIGITIALIAVGAIATVAYVLHARRTTAPILDLTLLKLPSVHAAVVGGLIYRGGIGGMPFLLPLLLQLGFGFSAFESGLITIVNVVGALGMKLMIPIVLRRLGFRNALMANALISSVFVGACATFTPDTSLVWMLAILGIGGFFRSLQYTSLNTIAYADLDNHLLSRATSLVAVAQQLSIALGVAIGAGMVDLTMLYRGHTEIVAADFQPAWIVIALISSVSALLFWNMPPNIGAEVSRRAPT
jgi:MFS family permease